jgi:hypothetical protein
MSGSWVDGEGIQTDSTGLLQANWVHSELVTPAVIVIKATRPAGTIGDVTVTANAIAFGVAISFTETLPGSFNEVIVPITPETAGESGTSVNFTLDASQPLTLESVEIRGQFDNPFPINYCGDISETPTVAITDTPSPVPTGTPTPTPTGTLATPTPTATPDINFYVMDATGSGSWSVGFPDIAAENFNILRESSDPIAGIYYNITVTFTGDGPHELSVYPDYAGAYSPFAIGNEFNGVQFLLLYTQNQDFGFGFLSDTTLANLIDADTGYTRLFHINAGALSGLQAISVGANTVHQADFYYRQQVVVNWARLVYYGAPPSPPSCRQRRARHARQSSSARPHRRCPPHRVQRRRQRRAARPRPPERRCQPRRPLSSPRLSPVILTPTRRQRMRRSLPYSTRSITSSIRWNRTQRTSVMLLEQPPSGQAVQHRTA